MSIGDANSECSRASSREGADSKGSKLTSMPRQLLVSMKSLNTATATFSPKMKSALSVSRFLYEDEDGNVTTGKCSGSTKENDSGKIAGVGSGGEGGAGGGGEEGHEGHEEEAGKAGSSSGVNFNVNFSNGDCGGKAAGTTSATMASTYSSSANKLPQCDSLSIISMPPSESLDFGAEGAVTGRAPAFRRSDSKEDCALRSRKYKNEVKKSRMLVRVTNVKDVFSGVGNGSGSGSGSGMVSGVGKGAVAAAREAFMSAGNGHHDDRDNSYRSNGADINNDGEEDEAGRVGNNKKRSRDGGAKRGGKATKQGEPYGDGNGPSGNSDGDGDCTAALLMFSRSPCNTGDNQSTHGKRRKLADEVRDGFYSPERSAQGAIDSTQTHPLPPPAPTPQQAFKAWSKQFQSSSSTPLALPMGYFYGGASAHLNDSLTASFGMEAPTGEAFWPT